MDDLFVLVFGTRPEIIKLSPVIRELVGRRRGFVLVHTGQHYSYEMDRVFFEELELPEPDYRLDVGLKARTHGEQVGLMLIEIEKILLKEKPRVVIVQGDTNTTLAGALSARKLNSMKIAHVEAGLRSYNWEMPEEINRIIVDHISDILFAPTVKAKENLLREGIPESRIHLVGNTVSDAVHQNLEIAKRKSRILGKLGVKKGRYFLLTLHRAENVDHKDRLASILEGVRLVKENFPEYDIVFPIHPRTKKRVKEFRLEEYLRDLLVIDPVGYLDFLMLEANARLILTDSGGAQEEACILKVPCVTLRTETERPETVEIGANIVAGRDPNNILKSVKIMLSKERDWINPYGVNVSQKIVSILEEQWH